MLKTPVSIGIAVYFINKRPVYQQLQHIFKRKP